MAVPETRASAAGKGEQSATPGSCCRVRSAGAKAHDACPCLGNKVRKGGAVRSIIRGAGATIAPELIGLPAPPADRTGADTKAVDLMDALKKSLQSTGGREPNWRPRAANRNKPSGRTGVA